MAAIACGVLAVAAVSAAGGRPTATALRDRWGAPHVYAASRRAVFFAYGYVRAQDDAARLRNNLHGLPAGWSGMVWVTSTTTC